MFKYICITYSIEVCEHDHGSRKTLMVARGSTVQQTALPHFLAFEVQPDGKGYADDDCEAR